MFVIDLRSADGTTLPFQLVIEPHDEERARIQVVTGPKIHAEGFVSYIRIPLIGGARDVRVGNLSLGFEPLRSRLLVEFGEDPRLGTVPADEVKAAICVCRCYDSVTNY